MITRKGLAMILIGIVMAFAGCGGSGGSQHERSVHQAVHLLMEMEADLKARNEAHDRARALLSRIHLAHGAYFTTGSERRKARPFMEKAEAQLARQQRAAGLVAQIEKRLMSFDPDVRNEAARAFRRNRGS